MQYPPKLRLSPDSRSIRRFCDVIMRQRAQQPFAGLQGAPREGLLVFGVSAELHRDDAAASDVETCLLPCWCQADNLTDRWDARLLLEDPVPRPGGRPTSRAGPGQDAGGDASEEELQLERYRDLDYSREADLLLHGRALSAPALPDSPAGSPEREYEGALPPPPGFAAIPFSYGMGSEGKGGSEGEGPVAGARGGTAARTGGAFHAVGFSYGPPAEEELARPGSAGAAAVVAGQAQMPTPGPDEPAFVPSFVIPEHLRRSLPATERHFKVIQQTAGFVREGGGQLEVLLRVKQAGNPLFAFLLPGDPLHAFYRWLVQTRPQDLVVIDAAPGAATVGGEEAMAGAAGEVGAVATAAAQRNSRLQHPSEQWRAGPAEQPPPWREPQREQRAPVVEYGPAQPSAAAQTAAAPAVEYGPVLPPPEAEGSLALLSQYDDDWGTQRSMELPALQQAQQQTSTLAAAASQEQQVPTGAASAGEPAGREQGRAAAEAPVAGEEAGTAVASLEADGGMLRPSNAAPDAIQPPPEMVAVMEKLVKFIQKNGAKFEGMVRAKESGNPVFAFLLPWSKHHQRYRSMLEEVLGESEAATVLSGITTSPPPPAASALGTAAATATAPLPAGQPAGASTPGKAPAPAPGEQQAAPPWAAAAAAGPQQQQERQLPATSTPPTLLLATATPAAASADGSFVLPPWLKEKMVAAASATTAPPHAVIKLQANPAIAKVVPKTTSTATGVSAEGEQAVAGAVGEEGSEGEGSGGEPSSAVAEAGGELDQAAVEAEEQKKAGRRRRARELLLLRQQEAAAAAARQRQQQLSAISIHRRAFLLEEGDGGGYLRLGQAASSLPGSPAAAAGRPSSAPGSAGGRGWAGEEEEEGEIVATSPSAAASASAAAAATRHGQVVAASRPPEPRPPPELPSVEDLVALRMKRAASAGALSSGGGTEAAGGPAEAAGIAGRELRPGQQQQPLPPPGRTIARHRAALGAEEGGAPLAKGGRLYSEPKGGGEGEAALHLRRIRDRIAAMTAGSAPGDRAAMPMLARPANSAGTASASQGEQQVRSGRESWAKRRGRSQSRSSSRSGSGSRGGSHSSSSGRSASRSASLSPRRHKRHHRSSSKKRQRRRSRSRGGERSASPTRHKHKNRHHKHKKSRRSERDV